MFVRNFHKLNSVVKSYLSVIIPDLILCCNFLPRDMYHLHTGQGLST
jgi:hypothetical protein